VWQALATVPRRSGSLAMLAVLALAFAGCGSHLRSAAPPAAVQAANLTGSPAPLAALHAQANRLLGGGVGAFAARMAVLRGYPVVVNKWAHWCDPCQSEFPVFQRVSVAFGRRVAFMGLDANDQSAGAQDFLRQFPVSYPSYEDPRSTIANHIRAATYFPQTVFFDRRGRIVYDHVGPYESVRALEQDIRHYLSRPA
jgi:cytochrome c biogenesis protein CcmG, thiol:disulfide interchange protein DsbE